MRFAALVLAAFTVAYACDSNPNVKCLKIGFPLFGGLDDKGWSWRHWRGLVYMQENFRALYPNVALHVNVSEYTKKDSPLFQEWCLGGTYDLIICTSFDFQDECWRLAPQCPETVFLQIAGNISNWQKVPNWGTAMGRMYQPLFLQGFVAAKALRGQFKIGTIAPRRVPEVYREQAAFAKGAMHANARVEIHTVWTESWSDPELEAYAVQGLIEEYKVDHVVIHADSVAAYKSVKAKDRTMSGFYADHRTEIGEDVLVSSYLFWGPIYLETLRLIYLEEWDREARVWWPHWNDPDIPNTVALTEFSFLVPNSLVNLVDRLRTQLIARIDRGADLFCDGEVITNTGESITPDNGDCLSDNQLLHMRWLPKNVRDHGTVKLPSRACKAGEIAQMTWTDGHVEVNCTRCPVNTTANNTAAISECVACLPPLWSSGGDMPCIVPCSPGQFVNKTANLTLPKEERCIACPPGTFSEAPDSEGCTLCDGETIQSVSGQPTCIPCSHGTRPNVLHTVCTPKPAIPLAALVIPVSAVVFVVIVILILFALRKSKQRRKATELRNAPKGVVYIVFTDVEDSTTLWTRDPTTMGQAKKVLFDAKRALLKKYRGYEVKTHGDSIMATFHHSAEALNWSFELQNQLLKEEWPPALAVHPECITERTPAGQLLFAGLRVRMGMHAGEPGTQYNSVANRVDYFGPVVNYAARVSGLGKGGQIISSQTFVDTLHGEECIEPLGVVQLKGIEGFHMVHNLIVPELKDRHFPSIGRSENIEIKRLRNAPHCQPADIPAYQDPVPYDRKKKRPVADDQTSYDDVESYIESVTTIDADEEVPTPTSVPSNRIVPAPMNHQHHQHLESASAPGLVTDEYGASSSSGSAFHGVLPTPQY